MSQISLQLSMDTTVLQEAIGIVLESQAIADVLTERTRQVQEEGWTAEHDDGHAAGELAYAGAAYALHAGDLLGLDPVDEGYSGNDLPPMEWPWALKWWKPRDPRRNLVKAGALILAEIERIDRAATANTVQGEQQ